MNKGDRARETSNQFLCFSGFGGFSGPFSVRSVPWPLRLFVALEDSSCNAASWLRPTAALGGEPLSCGGQKKGRRPPNVGRGILDFDPVEHGDRPIEIEVGHRRGEPLSNLR